MSDCDSSSENESRDDCVHKKINSKEIALERIHAWNKLPTEQKNANIFRFI